MSLKLAIIRLAPIVLAGSVPCTGLAQAVAPGIPAPRHCLAADPPALPAGWPDTAARGFYYVDVSAPGATDANNPFGSRAHPRRSLPSGDLEAGSYVELHGGPYVAERYVTVVRGTAAAPVWIRGADREQPTVIRAEWVVSGSHGVLENFKFDTSRKDLALGASTAVCVRFNRFEGPGLQHGNAAAVYVGGGSADTMARGNVIYRNVIHGFGDAGAAKENDYHGVLVGRWSESTWILENEIYDNGGDAVQVGQANLREDRPRFVYIANNRLYGNRENAVDIKRAGDVVVSLNEIHDYRPTSSSEGAGIVVHNDPERIWIFHNAIYRSEFGVVATGSRDTWLVGNVLYDIRSSRDTWKPGSAYNSGAAIHFRGRSDGGVIGNTVAWCDTGLQLAQGTAAGYTIQNNIFAFRTEEAGDDIYVASGSFSAAVTVSHNLHYGGAGGFRSSWEGERYDSLARLERQSGQFGDSLEDDPAFADAGKRDFRLRGDSPAIGAAIRTDIDARFRAQYGIGIDTGSGQPGDDGSAAGSVIGASPRAGPAAAAAASSGRNEQ
jgi:hypothetical protein